MEGLEFEWDEEKNKINKQNMVLTLLLPFTCLMMRTELRYLITSIVLMRTDIIL
jgi:hypothetical protein